MELFTIPGVGGIIETNMNGIDYILIQERFKEDAPLEKGLIEIPAGKIREYENIFECLRREIKEETGMEVVSIQGESESFICESNGYKVITELAEIIYVRFLPKEKIHKSTVICYSMRMI